MEKEVKVICGDEIETIQGEGTYITCITKNGERFSIGFRQLFKLFDNYRIVLQKHGDHFRTIGFDQHSQDVEELSPLKYIQKLS